MLTELKSNLRKPLLPAARWLEGVGAQPDHLTIAGVAASVLAGLSLALGHLVLGFIWTVVALLCDMLDGDLARLHPERTTRFGAFLDSCADRISEAFLFGGWLIGKLEHTPSTGVVWLLFWILALAGSFMVSYTRARAEGLGIRCTVGIAERPERMVVLLLMIIAGFGVSLWFLLALSLLSWVTVWQRSLHAARQLGGAEDA